jgi:thymidine kinase
MSLRVVVGPMFAGKTSEIQSVVRRYTCLGRQVLVLTADIDNRYQTGDVVSAVVSHDRTAVPARAVAVAGGLRGVPSWPEFAAATAVVVDEAQFFVDCLVPFVQEAVGAGKHVVVVGLDGDARQRPFGDVLALIPLADSVEKKTALCRHCGDGTPAIFTRRFTVDASGGATQVAVGGADMYEPVCRRHFSLGDS